MISAQSDLSGRPWPDVHSEALRQCLDDKMSFSKAAAAINAQFDTSYSRNALIGRASRMGLSSQLVRGRAKGEVRKQREYKPRIRIVPANGNSNKQRIIEIGMPEIAALRCVEVTPRNLTLLELEAGDCRYPYGDGEITFCGHAKFGESSYCGPHYALSRSHGHDVSPGGREKMRRTSRTRHKRMILEGTQHV